MLRLNHNIDISYTDGFNDLTDTDISRMGRETTRVSLQKRGVPLYAFKKSLGLRLLLRGLCSDLPASSLETFCIIECALNH